MKKSNIILLILFVSGMLHLTILWISWNIKQGDPVNFYIIPVVLGVSFIVNTLFYLSWAEIIRLPSQKINVQGPKRKDESPLFTENYIPREFVDPKLAAEKLFKKLGQRYSLKSFGNKLLANISDEVEIMQGIFYVLRESRNIFEPSASYAISGSASILEFMPGEGIPGEAVKKTEITIISDIPSDFRLIESGLGKRSPRFIYMVPFIFENRCLGLLELSTFMELPENKMNILNYCMQIGGEKLSQFQDNNYENRS